MAVNWNWKDKSGTMVLEGLTGDKYTLNIYAGTNCLAVLLYEYKQNNENMYTFNGYWGDIAHLKRCINGGVYEGVKKIKLNTYYRDALKIADAFTKNTKAKVELYYQTPKIKD